MELSITFALEFEWCWMVFLLLEEVFLSQRLAATDRIQDLLLHADFRWKSQRNYYSTICWKRRIRQQFVFCCRFEQLVKVVGSLNQRPLLFHHMVCLRLLFCVKFHPYLTRFPTFKLHQASSALRLSRRSFCVWAAASASASLPFVSVTCFVILARLRRNGLTTQSANRCCSCIDIFQMNKLLLPSTQILIH